MYKHLTYGELCTIWHHKVNKFTNTLLPLKSKTVYELAELIGKHRSTIYRAINYIKCSKWVPENRILPVVKFRKRKHKCQKIEKPKIIKYIKEKLEIGWSPEVISGRMHKDIKISVSFKSIYRYIWEVKLFGGKLHKLLPHQGKRYRYGNQNRCPIKNRIDISDRPAIVEEKKRIGDIEGDTVVGVKGGNKDCLLTLVDRASKYTIIRKLPNRTALSVEPYRSCDRGLNEHTNGLIRKFFPKKTDFANISEKQIEHVQNLLNDRPTYF